MIAFSDPRRPPFFFLLPRFLLRPLSFNFFRIFFCSSGNSEIVSELAFCSVTVR